MLSFVFCRGDSAIAKSAYVTFKACSAVCGTDTYLGGENRATKNDE